MKNRILVFLICITATAWAQPNGTLVDGIAAVIGGQKVLISDIENTFIQYQSQDQGIGEDQKCVLFEDQLYEALLIHHAAVDSVEVSEEEVESMMNRRLDILIRQVGSQKRLEDFYGKTVNEIKEEMRPLMRNQLIAQRMNGQITEGVNITPGEVKAFYKGIPADSIPLVNSEVEVAQIVFKPEVSEEARQEAIGRLNDIKQRIVEGSSFTTMAVLYSEDPGSSSNGGEYLGVGRGQFVPQFEAVAFSLEEGEISDPFETEYGYHIIQLIAKRGQQVDLRHILIKPKLGAEQLEAAREKLDSIRTLIIDGIYTFGEMAGKYSADKLSKNNQGMIINESTGDTKFEVSELDRAVYFSIEEINVGDVTRVMTMNSPDGEKAFRILKLISRSEPHRANLEDDYQLIQDLALAKKREKALKSWVDEKISETYIRVNNYCGCSFEYNWEQDL
jgi:peptidyl-prolyl cis-trans isomerase SurA